MSTRVKDAGEFFEAEIATFDRFWQFQFFARSSRAFKPVTLGAPSAENVDFVVIQTHLHFVFDRTQTIKRFTSIRLPATAAVPQGVRLA